MKINNKILESFELPEGLEIDIAEGWKKITSRQFGGDPGRGFGEIIQNLLDSYSNSIPIEERKGVIKTTQNSISITDYGEGFTPEKIKLIITLGGTDKANDNSKIGQFGIGFFSIFNASLGTKRVVVTTRCQGFTVQIIFAINSTNEVPDLDMKIIDDEIDFSTKIDITFKYNLSVDKCLKYARQSLKYYPCKIMIDGEQFNSIWEIAKKQNWYTFNNQFCNGYIKPSHQSNWVTLLCKYEYIMSLPLNSLLRGSVEPSYNLTDFRDKSFPIIPYQETSVNCNNLSLTISRDSFYLNYNYINMLDNLKEEFYYLLTQQNYLNNLQLVLANLYILSYEVGQYIKTGELSVSYSEAKKTIVKNLVSEKIFSISGAKKLYNVLELKKMLSDGLPLFYSSNKMNIRWLGGAFKHDFVLLPETCHIENGAPDFYNRMFTDIFSDIIDLDHIQGNNKIIKTLVEKGIVHPEALNPGVDFIGEKKISSTEHQFLEEINQILRNKEVINAIEKNLYLNIRSVKAVFFEIHEEGAYISAGLFDQNLVPLGDDFISNFERKDKTEEDYQPNVDQIILGLRKDHPLIQQLINSDTNHKTYFALTYIAHELSFCQRLLVPYSSFYHFTKERLASDMRKALMDSLFTKAV